MSASKSCLGLHSACLVDLIALMQSLLSDWGSMMKPARAEMAWGMVTHSYIKKIHSLKSVISTFQGLTWWYLSNE